MIVMQVPGHEVTLEAAPDILDFNEVIEGGSNLEPISIWITRIRSF
jgi:hypothetical protein